MSENRGFSILFAYSPFGVGSVEGGVDWQCCRNILTLFSVASLSNIKQQSLTVSRGASLGEFASIMCSAYCSSVKFIFLRKVHADLHVPLRQ